MNWYKNVFVVPVERKIIDVFIGGEFLASKIENFPVFKKENYEGVKYFWIGNDFKIEHKKILKNKNVFKYNNIFEK